MLCDWLVVVFVMVGVLFVMFVLGYVMLLF